MKKKMMLAAMVVSVGMFVARAGAQAQDGPTPEQQAMQDQMQQMRETVMANMAAKGIDPQSFFQEMRQQAMSGGGFDPADMQQMLLDKGLIDQQTISNFQTVMQKASAADIRRQMEADDTEWAVLEPLIQKVLDAAAAMGPTNRGGGGMGMAGFMRGKATTSEVAKAMKDLRVALKDTSTPADVIAEKLATLREARRRAKIDFDLAQKQLTAALTERQEAVLMNAGIVQ